MIGGRCRRRGVSCGRTSSIRSSVTSRPPRFRLFVNDRRLVTRDYGYWLENELRRRFGLDGVPLSIDFVTST